MLTATFRHIPGIGRLRERQLWGLGIARWDALPAQGEVLSPRLDGKLREGVRRSAERLSAGDLDHFARLLPPTEHWRLLPELLAGAAFVDVEIGALGGLSVVGVLDAQGVRSFVAGSDLDQFP